MSRTRRSHLGLRNTTRSARTGRRRQHRDGTSPVAIFQPVLTHYRVDFLSEIDRKLSNGVVLFSDAPDPGSALIDGTDSISVPVRRSRTYRVGPAWFVPRALAAIASGDWSLVVLSWNARQVELLPALLLGRRTRTPIVLWGHGVGRSGSRAALMLRRVQARLASAIVVYSHGGAQEVRRIAASTPVVVAQNTTGRTPPSSGEELRSPSHSIGYVGRLDERKHLDRLLEAVADLRRRGLALTVSFLGDGPDAEHLKLLARSLGLGDAAIFREATGDWEEVKAHLQGLDVVVFPEIGGLGVVDAFAAARGAVVLDSAVRNPPEAENVTHHETGARYPEPDAGSLADAVAQLYDDDLIVSCSHNAARHYRERLTMSAAVDPFVDVIEALLTPEAGRFGS